MYHGKTSGKSLFCLYKTHIYHAAHTVAHISVICAESHEIHAAKDWEIRQLTAKPEKVYNKDR